MSLAVSVALAPIETPPTHVVESSITSLPHIVERASECGAVRIHVPHCIPAQIRLCVERVQSHGFDVPKSVVAGKTLVMQGVVVRCEAQKMLVSHGGLMMHIDRADTAEFKGSDLVRTTITF